VKEIATYYWLVWQKITNAKEKKYMPPSLDLRTAYKLEGSRMRLLMSWRL